MENEGKKRPSAPPITAAAEIWANFEAEWERKRAEAATAASGRKARAKGKRPCAEKQGSASATTGRESQAKGKNSCVENSSSASATTVMDEMEAEAKRLIFELISSRPAFNVTEAPRSPEYVDLSEYPPGSGIEYEHVFEVADRRIVAKVPRWAREKWRLKNQDDASDPEESDSDGSEDTSPSGLMVHQDVWHKAAGAKGWKKIDG